MFAIIANVSINSILLFFVNSDFYVSNTLLSSITGVILLSYIASGAFDSNALLFFSTRCIFAWSAPSSPSTSSTSANSMFASSFLLFLITDNALLSLLASDALLFLIINDFWFLVAGGSLFFAIFNNGLLSSLFLTGFLVIHLLIILSYARFFFPPLYLFYLLVLQYYLLEKDYLIKHL